MYTRTTLCNDALLQEEAKQVAEGLVLTKLPLLHCGRLGHHITDRYSVHVKGKSVRSEKNKQSSVYK